MNFGLQSPKFSSPVTLRLFACKSQLCLPLHIHDTLTQVLQFFSELCLNFSLCWHVIGLPSSIYARLVKYKELWWAGRVP